jgi:hypothetical protein
VILPQVQKSVKGETTKALETFQRLLTTEGTENMIKKQVPLAPIEIED